MANTTAPGTIVLKCNGLSQRADEARAAGTITPGHLVAHNSTGAVVVHPTAGGVAEAIFAKEDSLQGRIISDNYSSGDLVQLHRAQKGDEIYALVPAGAAAIVINDNLSSNGDGTLVKAGAASQSGTTPFAVTPATAVVAKALEALDNSGGGAVARLRVRVI